MLVINDDLAIPEEELRFAASRSSGPGGQHVNKASTRVMLRFDVLASPSLTDEQRERILARLATRISKAGVMLVVAQKHRSQSANRELARERFTELLRTALQRRRSRRPTSVPETVKQRRLEEKRRRGKLKRERGRPDLGEG